MPTTLACPRCGEHALGVSDDGLCLRCGRPIAEQLPPPAPAGARVGAGAVLIVLLVVMLLCGGGATAIVVPLVAVARSEAQRAQSQGHLKMLAIAIHSYHDEWGQFPPAIVKDTRGKPLYSGRVLLLPYLEQQSLYEAWDLSKPWDSPQNLPLARTTLEYFHDPSAGKGQLFQTDYLFVTGRGTIFEDGPPIYLYDVTDGVSNTIMMVEVKQSGISWAEPRDLDISKLSRLPPGNRRSGNLVLFADGSTQSLPRTTSFQEIRAATTRGGGETTNLSQ
jgi:hypothetical protein